MLGRAKGFTLLELLIVLAIFGLFAAMAYGGLNHVLNTRRQLEVSLDTIATWQRSFQKLRNDFQLVSNRTARNSFNNVEPALRFEEFGARVEFTHSSWRNPLFAPRATLERVVVRYDEKEKTLVRESYGVMDRARDDQTRKLVLLSDVTEVKWRFMDSTREWQTAWPPATVAAATAQPPPLAVELTVNSKEYPEVRWVFRLGENPVPAGGSSSSSGSSGSSGSTGGSQP